MAPRRKLHRILSWTGRLTVRVTVCNIVLVALLTTALVHINLSSGEALLKERLLLRTDQIGTLLADLTASHVSDLRALELAVLLEDIGRQRDVRHASIVDAQGLVLADSDEADDQLIKRSEEALVLAALASGQKQLRVDPQTIHAAFPVRLGNRLIGAVHLAMSLEEVQASIRRINQEQLLTASAILALAIPLCAFLMVRAMRPILHLASVARRIAGGDLDHDTPHGATSRAPGEVGELQRAFRVMLLRLRHGLDKVERLAFVDGITGLPNRQAFGRLVAQAVADPTEAAGRGGQAGKGAVVFVDLDRFKKVNDTLGHAQGDELLRLVGLRLAAVVADRPGVGARVIEGSRTRSWRDWIGRPVVARLGGDEFTLLLPGETDREALQAVGSRIVEALSAVFVIDGQEVRIGASVGITAFPSDGTSAERLLRNADLAMYAAKEAGRGSTCFYSAELEAGVLERLTLERDLRAALARDEFRVFYQPQVSCESGRIIGAEALVRWQHPTRGLLPPSAFLDVAEETGLIVEMGWLVLRRAAEDAAKLERTGRPISIAVNLSALQFERADFVARVSDALEVTGLRPDLLELELTESIAMRDPERVLSRIAPLRERGVRFAIDDFGTGYSSLNYLTKLPFTTLKIDRSFVQAIRGSARDQALVTTILRMAESLKLGTVAEGVESQADFDFVREGGASLAQGYLFAPPLAFPEFSALHATMQGIPAAVEPAPAGPLAPAVVAVASAA